MPPDPFLATITSDTVEAPSRSTRVATPPAVRLPAASRRRRRGSGRGRHRTRDGAVRRPSRLGGVAPGARRFMVIATGPEDLAAVDLASGAVARLRIDPDHPTASDPAPFDVLDAVVVDEATSDDLAQPDALELRGAAQLVGRLRGHWVRRLLRGLVAPVEPQLLGFSGVSAPYWEFRGMRPSVAVVAPSRGPLVFRRRSDDSVWARFGWPGSDNWVPVEDRRVIAALWAARRERLSGKDLAAALGFRPHYLVVTVSTPRHGHCYKTVAALLARP